jgi:hypothetical protein
LLAQTQIPPSSSQASPAGQPSLLEQMHSPETASVPCGQAAPIDVRPQANIPNTATTNK